MYTERVTIIGSGIAGLTMALLLRNKVVTVYEKNTIELLKYQSNASTFNITLSNRSIRVLSKIDKNFHSFLEQNSARIMGRSIFYAKVYPFFSIRMNIDHRTGKCVLNDGNVVLSDWIIGSDGIKSKTAEMCAIHRNVTQSGFGYLEIELDYATYKNLIGKDLNYLCSFPSVKQSVCIFLPTIPCEKVGLLWIATNEIMDAVKKDTSNFYLLHPNFNGVFEIQEALEKKLVGNVRYVDTPNWMNGKAFLIGDAAHATVPFYGQGANSAIEDAYLLSRDVDLKVALTSRKASTDSLLRLSLKNLDNVCGRSVIYSQLDLFFSKWIPFYMTDHSLVSQSSLTYVVVERIIFFKHVLFWPIVAVTQTRQDM